MDKLLLKRMALLSAILGASLGILTLIPIINFFSFISLIFLSSVFVFFYMQKVKLLGILDLKQSTLYGTFIGFVSFLAFCVSFLPLAALIGVFYKNSFYLGISILFRQGFFILVFLVFFTAILFGALMNSFSAFIYSQFNSLLFDDNIKKNTDIDIKID